MPTQPIYPPLTDLLDPTALTDSLGFLSPGIELVFGSLFYKDLQILRSRFGDKRTYKLSILTGNDLGFEIPGTPLKLIVNAGGISSPGSEIPVYATVHWPILKYINSFDPSAFIASPESFYELILEITGISSKDLIRNSIKAFVTGPNPITDFINEYNTAHPSETVSVVSDPDEEVFLDNLISAFDSAQIDIYELIFNDYILTNLEVDTYQRLEKAFIDTLGHFNRQNLRELVTPKVLAAISNMSITLEVEDSILRQVDPITKAPLQDAGGNDVPAQLTLNVGSLIFNSERGLYFEENLSTTFHESEILRTGFTIAFSQLKLDLSQKSNITEAVVAGRPKNFMGVYAKNATISMPNFWQKDESASNAQIAGTDILIGTGGISGKFNMKSVDPTNPALLKATIGPGGFTVSLDGFSFIHLDKNKKSSEEASILEVPNFKTDAQFATDRNYG